MKTENATDTNDDGGSVDPAPPPAFSAMDMKMEARYQRRALVLGVMQAAPHLSVQALKVHVEGLEDFIAEAGAESDG